MALGTFIAGPYTATYNSNDTGITQDGFRLRQSVNKELIRGDAYGDSVLDGVYRGGDVHIIFDGIEYSDAIDIAWTYGNLGVMGQVGRLDYGSAIAAATVLTAVAGTTAANTPATLTASQSIIDENHQTELAFRAGLRNVPIALRCYPYDNGGSPSWFTTT